MDDLRSISPLCLLTVGLLLPKIALPGDRLLIVVLPHVLPLILTVASAAHVERSAVVPGISSATLRTAKLADSPFAIIAIGNGHVQG